MTKTYQLLLVDHELRHTCTIVEQAQVLNKLKWPSSGAGPSNDNMFLRHAAKKAKTFVALSLGWQDQRSSHH